MQKKSKFNHKESSFLLLPFNEFKKRFEKQNQYQSILNSFKNQSDDILNFLSNQAEIFDKRNFSKTFILLPDKENPEIIGFFSLCVKGLLSEELHFGVSKIKEITGLSPKEQKRRGRFIALFYLIGQLAVSEDFQKQGYGTRLIAEAIKKICKAQDNVGIRYILVDAINQEEIISFYEKLTFIRANDEENENIQKETQTMVANIKEIKQLLSSYF